MDPVLQDVSTMATAIRRCEGCVENPIEVLGDAFLLFKGKYVIGRWNEMFHRFLFYHRMKSFGAIFTWVSWPGAQPTS